MALMQCSFFSEALGMCTSANVILPQTTTGQIGLKGKGTPDGCPVLYLLHGLSDDHSIWLRRTNIERYATQFGIAVVMPNGYRSFYTDAQNGIGYWRYVSEELPKIMGSFFKFSQQRKDTFVCGLSMGGYGSMKLALNLPDRFAAAGCFSSVTRPWRFAEFAPFLLKEMQSIFGDDLASAEGTLNDPFFMAEKQYSVGVEMPRFFLACGTEDGLFPENTDFRDKLLALGADVEFRAEPGTHEWGFWDRQVLAYLNWLKERNLLA